MIYVEPETVITGELTDRGYKFNKLVAAIVAMWKGVAAGDMEYYTGATAKARLAISTAGKELGVAESGIAPGWLAREDMQLIESFTAVGGETSHKFSAIPQTFRHLRLFISGKSLKAGQTYAIIGAEVNDDTGANYAINGIVISNNGFTQSYAVGYSFLFLGYIQCTNAVANYPNVMDILIPNYANETFYKVSQSINSMIYSANLAGCFTDIRHAMWKNTNPITSLKVWTTSTTYSFAAGSKISLYGLR